MLNAIKVLKRYYWKAVRVFKQYSRKYYGIALQHPSILITLGFIGIAIVLLWYPQLQVSKFGITTPKDLADAENNYRATLAQIFGGFALLLGLYFTWRNLVIAKEGQITERFTRAIEQFGNEKTEIKLGGIYALERIAKESKKYYWPIMKILTAYIKRESSQWGEVWENNNKIPAEIQTILEVLFNHEHPNNDVINLQNVILIEAELNRAILKWADLRRANLKRADLAWANLESSNLNEANLEKASIWSSNLQYANLIGANLEKANLEGANLENARLVKSNFRWADLSGANLKGATCKEADFTKADLHNADLTGAFFLTPDQLCKARSLYNTKLDEEFSNILKDRHPNLFENPLTEEEIKRRMEILTSLGAVPCNRD